MELGWNTLPQLMDEARTIAAKHEQAAVRIRADRDLSAEAKARRLAENEAARRQAVAALKEEAAKRVDGARSLRTTELANKRRRQHEERVKLLGPEEYSRLLRAELEVMSASEIRTRYETAPTAWEKEMVKSYGSIELRRRMANRVPTADELGAQHALSEGPDAEIVALEREIVRLDDFRVDLEMDRHAAAQRLSGNMGVMYEHALAADLAAVTDAA